MGQTFTFKYVIKKGNDCINKCNEISQEWYDGKQGNGLK